MPDMALHVHAFVQVGASRVNGGPSDELMAGRKAETGIDKNDYQLNDLKSTQNCYSPNWAHVSFSFCKGREASQELL